MTADDETGLILPVTRVTYTDGSQELFLRSLKMVRADGWLEFHDPRGRVFQRPLERVAAIAATELLCGAGLSGNGSTTPAPAEGGEEYNGEATS